MFRPLIAFVITALVALPASASDMVKVGTLMISGAYSFETPPAAKAAGGYLTIENTGSDDDVLVAAQAGQGMVMLHKSETDANGVARMVHQENGIPVPAGETVMLAPGGLHIMFMGLSAPFEAGASIDVTLTFETAGDVVVAMPVVERGSAHDAGHGDHDGH